VIRRKRIVGVDYVSIDTPEDFEEWCLSEGWAGALDFTTETNADFETLRGIWFMYTPGPQRHFVYTRTLSGIRAIF